MKRSLALSLIGALVLLGSVVGAYYVSWLIVNPPPMLSIGLEGTVSISVNGREVIRQTDLPTNAFYQVLQNILNGISTSTTNGWNTQCLIFVASQGTSDLGTITVGSNNWTPLTSGGSGSCMYTGGVYNAGNPLYTEGNWSSSLPQPLWVGIGVGTGTVGRNDKALFTKLAVASATFTLNTQNPIGFTIAGSITISGTATITESALYYINCANVPNGGGCFGTTTNYAYWALMLQHDTFQGVSVNPGDVITVAYTINMPTSCTSQITTNCSNLGLAYLVGNCLTHTDVSGGIYSPFCLTHPNVASSSGLISGQAGLNPLVALFDNSVSPAKTASATTMSVVWLNNNNYINIYGVAQAPLGLYDTVIYSFTIAGSGGLSAQVLQYKTTSSPINLVAGQAVGFQLQGP